MWSPFPTLYAGRSRGGSGIGLWCRTGFEHRVKLISFTPGLCYWILLDNFHLVGCFYAPPILTPSQFIDLLQIPDCFYTDSIILGDLNCRLGRLTNDSITNPRGATLTNWIHSHLFSLVETEWKPTCFNHGQSMIDIAISNNIEPSFNILSDPLGSDHLPIQILLHSSPITPDPHRVVNQIPLWKMHKLQNPDVIATFDTACTDLNSKLTSLMTSIETWTQLEIDMIDELITNDLCSIATGVLGISNGFQFTRLQSEELDNMLSKRKYFYRFGRWEDYDNINQEITLERRRLATQKYQTFCTELRDKDKTVQMKFLHALKTKHSRCQTLLKSDPESLEEYGQHFSSMYSRRVWYAQRASS